MTFGLQMNVTMTLKVQWFKETVACEFPLLGLSLVNNTLGCCQRGIAPFFALCTSVSLYLLLLLVPKKWL
jgi:hypothetical protein